MVSLNLTELLRFLICWIRNLISFEKTGYSSSSNTILDEVLSFHALCFHLRCTDRDVWIASKRQGVVFTSLFPQGAEISLIGKYNVLLCNLVVSVAGQDLLILKLKRNIHLFLDNSKQEIQL